MFKTNKLYRSVYLILAFTLATTLIVGTSLTANAATIGELRFQKVFYGGTGNQVGIALTANNELWGWGSNMSGQLGSPVLIHDHGAVKIFDDTKDFSYADGATFAICGDDSLWVVGGQKWGQNNRDNGFQTEPKKIAKNVRSIDYPYFIKTDNTLWSFGSNYASDNATQNNPKKILDGVLDIKWLGGKYLILKTDETVWLNTRYDSEYIMGSVAAIDATLQSIRVGTGEVSNKTTSKHGALLLKKDGSLWHAQLSNDSVPEKILDGVISFNQADYQAFAVTKDGKLWGWGNNYECKVNPNVPEDSGGSVEWSSQYYDTPQLIAENMKVVCDGSGNTGFAVGTNGLLYSWGSVYDYVYGHSRAKPFGLADIKIAASVNLSGHYRGNPSDTFVKAETSSSGDSIMAVKADGSLWAWGNNSYGELGINTSKECVLEPKKIMDGIEDVSIGYSHSLALAKDGTVWACGSNSSGQLGIGNLRDVSTHVQILGIENAVQISAGQQFSLILTADGGLYAFGRNDGGRLGDGTEEDRGIPVKIMDSVSYATAGSDYALAVKQDGSVWEWGRVGWQYKFYYGDGMVDEYYVGRGEYYEERMVDGYGEGASVYITKPQKRVERAKYAYAQRTDFGKSAILSVDGNLQIYSGSNIDSIPYFTLTDINAASVGDAPVVIKSDGSVWGYGAFGLSETGEWKISFGELLRLMDPKSKAKAVAGGGRTIAVILEDGSLWIASNNQYGQLGNGTKTESLTFVQVATRSDSSLTGFPTASTVLVNGKSVAFDAYTINGNNYFKLRDLAYILSGTPKQFDVGWDGANNSISLTGGKAYTVTGGEMIGKGAGSKAPTPTNSKIILNDKEVSFTAYNIDGNNYFKLRDIGKAFSFGVDWDGARNTIIIDTDKGYIGD